MPKGHSSRQATDVSEAQTAVHWREEAHVSPPVRFIAQANLADPGIFERFLAAISNGQDPGDVPRSPIRRSST